MKSRKVNPERTRKPVSDRGRAVYAPTRGCLHPPVFSENCCPSRRIVATLADTAVLLPPVRASTTGDIASGYFLRLFHHSAAIARPGPMTERRNCIFKFLLSLGQCASEERFMPVHKQIGMRCCSAMNKYQAPASNVQLRQWLPSCRNAAFGLFDRPLQRVSLFANDRQQLLAESADPSLTSRIEQLPSGFCDQSCKSVHELLPIAFRASMFDLLRCTHFQNRARAALQSPAQLPLRKTHCGSLFFLSCPIRFVQNQNEILYCRATVSTSANSSPASGGSRRSRPTPHRCEDECLRCRCVPSEYRSEAGVSTKHMPPANNELDRKTSTPRTLFVFSGLNSSIRTDRDRYVNFLPGTVFNLNSRAAAIAEPDYRGTAVTGVKPTGRTGSPIRALINVDLPRLNWPMHAT